MKRALCIVALFPFTLFSLSPLSNTQIQKYKADPKGPFQYIRWFCPDGRVLLPSESCQQIGSIQHAVLKPEVTQLQDQNIFLGSILAGTDKSAFLDEKNRFSRA